MSFYTYDDKGFKKFIEGVDINLFSNELYKFLKKITNQLLFLYLILKIYNLLKNILMKIN